MTPWILAALSIYFVLTLLGATCQWLLGDKPRIIDALGPRDNPSPQTVIGARFDRALRNIQEALFIFLPVALLIETKSQTAGAATTSAMLFVGARALYVPTYASGVGGVRSVAWLCGHAGIAMMLLALLMG